MKKGRKGALSQTDMPTVLPSTYNMKKQNCRNSVFTQVITTSPLIFECTIYTSYCHCSLSCHLLAYCFFYFRKTCPLLGLTCKCLSSFPLLPPACMLQTYAHKTRFRRASAASAVTKSSIFQLPVSNKNSVKCK